MKKIYIHHSGERYIVLEESNKHCDKEGWYEWVTYASCTDGKIYSRSLSSFENKCIRIV